MTVKHDCAPVERRSVHHACRDLAANAGETLQPVHRLGRAHRLEMGKVDRAAHLDKSCEAGLQPFGGYLWVGLGRKLDLQFLERRFANVFP